MYVCMYTGVTDSLPTHTHTHTHTRPCPEQARKHYDGLAVFRHKAFAAAASFEDGRICTAAETWLAT